MEDLQNSTKNYCFNFTENELTTNTAVTVTLHTLAVSACLVTILFIFATKQYRIFMNRLVLYLMIAASLWSIAIIFEVIPVIHDQTLSEVKVRDGWGKACATIGFITQVVESVKVLIICWMSFYLLLLVTFKCNANKLNHEAVGVITIIVVPLLLDCLPFGWNKYGLSGLLCWIKLTNEHCDNIWEGLGLMLAVEYVPILLTFTLILTSFICIVITLCKRAHKTDIKWKWTSVYQRGLTEAAALMVYPFVYAIIFIFKVIHHIYYIVQITNTTPPTYDIWLVHSTVLGIGGMLVPILYLLRPSNLRKFYLCRKYFIKKNSASGVVYRSSSLMSTEDLSDGEGLDIKNSSIVYEGILNSQ